MTNPLEAATKAERDWEAEREARVQAGVTRLASQHAQWQAEDEAKDPGWKERWLADRESLGEAADGFRPPFDWALQHAPKTNEEALIGTLMTSPDAVRPLLALNKTGQWWGRGTELTDTRRAIIGSITAEFVDPRNARTVEVILERSAKGLRHDAASVTADLKERQSLPVEWDPTYPRSVVDPEQYGLAAWQQHARPVMTTGTMVAEVREHYIPRYLEIASIQATQLAREAQLDPGMTKETVAAIGKLYENTPATLTHTGHRVAHGEQLTMPIAPSRHLTMAPLPPRPMMSALGREAVSRG